MTIIIKQLNMFVFSAHDYGVSQLNNYATLIIDVTDVNDHTPTVLFTQVNGTIMNNRLINLPECSNQSKTIHLSLISLILFFRHSFVLYLHH